MKPTSAPLCIWCKAQPVTRDYHLDHVFPGGLGKRLVDGKRWHWFCSRVCQAAHAGSCQTPTCIDKATAKRRENFEQRITREVIAKCRAVMDPRGRITVKDVARLMVRERRTGYIRGFNACQQRVRRGKAAA